MRVIAALHKKLVSYFGAVDAPTASTIIPKAPMRNKTTGRSARSKGWKPKTETTWTTPQICEICVGMEVTAYMSAEI
jgi:coenzyme PQQ precursor peptide PqqA